MRDDVPDDKTTGSVTWPPPWYAVNNPEGLAAELRRELGPGHPLDGRSLRVIGRRDDCDDVLVALPDSHVAVVHLTWSGRRESLPFPNHVEHQTFAAFSEAAADADDQ